MGRCRFPFSDLGVAIPHSVYDRSTGQFLPRTSAPDLELSAPPGPGGARTWSGDRWYDLDVVEGVSRTTPIPVRRVQVWVEGEPNRPREGLVLVVDVVPVPTDVGCHECSIPLETRRLCVRRYAGLAVADGPAVELPAPGPTPTVLRVRAPDVIPFVPMSPEELHERVRAELGPNAYGRLAAHLPGGAGSRPPPGERRWSLFQVLRADGTTWEVMLGEQRRGSGVVRVVALSPRATARPTASERAALGAHLEGLPHTRAVGERGWEVEDLAPVRAWLASIGGAPVAAS